MTGYCVVISGRMPGDEEDAVVWRPVAEAFKLDANTFSENVLARMPLIVKKGLSSAEADSIVRRLTAAGVDAKAFPDTKLVLFERDGQTKGPLPFSSLGSFIRAGERYRFSDSTEWVEWRDVPVTQEQSDLGFSLDSPEAIPDQQIQSRQFSEDVPPPLPAEEPPPLIGAASSLSDPWGKPASEYAGSVEDLPPPITEEPPPIFCNSSTEQLWANYVPSSTEHEPPPAFPTGPNVEREQLPFSKRAVSTSRKSVAPDGGGLARRLVTGLVGLLVILVSCAAGYYFYAHRNPVPQALVGSNVEVQQANVAQVQKNSSSSPLPASRQPETSAPIQPPSVPAAMQTGATATDDCASEAPAPQTQEEKALLANGDRHLVGKAIRGGTAGEIYVVEAALGYDGQCRPSPYQIYTFRNGQQVGTVSPKAMTARTDGAITDFKFVDADHLQIQVSHYGPNAPACCASSTDNQILDLSQLSGDSQPASTSNSTLPRVRPQPSVEPSFDCHKAQSTIEMTICSNDELSNLDAQMGVLYRKVVDSAPQSNREAIKSDQRTWLRQREQCSSNAPCIEEKLNARIRQLRATALDEQASAHVAQLNQGKLSAARECFQAANYDCSIQLARSLLSTNPNNAEAVDLMRRSQEAQAQALHGNWNIH